MAPNYREYESFYPIPPNRIDKERNPIVTHKFQLNESTKNELRSMEPNFGFGQFGKIVYYRTYSRKMKELTARGKRRLEVLKNKHKNKLKIMLTNIVEQYYNEDRTILNTELTNAHKSFEKLVYDKLVEGRDYIERQEHWADTIIRCIEGCFSYRKDHMIKNGLYWNDNDWQDFAREMAISAFKMEWMPPGRGLWAGGTDYTYERGSACLNNCAYTNLDNLPSDIVWVFDMLMCGCGVGAKLSFTGKIVRPDKDDNETYIIADNREGWAESAGLLLRAYIPNENDEVLKFPVFDYSLIRDKGAKLNGFGGIASGYEPLKKYHKRIEIYLDTYLNYQEANTREEQLECFIDMVERLKEYDNPWLSLEMFDDLKNHLRGNSPIKRFTDLMKYVRWNAFSHLSDNEYNKILLEMTDSFIVDQIKILKDNMKVNDNELAKLNQDKYTKCFIPFFKDLRNVDLTEENILTSFIQCRNKLTLDIRNAKDKRIYNLTRLCADILNSTGACVVAGNIRRSSEIVGFDPSNQTALDLKDEIVNPERMSISWMSNNSAIFSKTEDFKLIPEIAKRVVQKGEPGFYNLLNVRRFGRIGRRRPKEGEWTREYEEDTAEFVNPCGEIPLNNKELCNLSELVPVRCRKEDGTFDEEKFNRAIKFATFYASSVSLLRTHWGCTNEIIARNRRIGVSITGGADLYDEIGFTEMTRVLRNGYRIVREENSKLAHQAGVPSSIRTTTVKPSGTVSQLAGVSSGMHFPIFQYANRRMRISSNSELGQLLKDADYPWEKDLYSDNTDVFSFPIDQGKTRKASDVNLWEKMRVLETFQREWADNAVSNTMEFDPKTEGDQIEAVLAQSAPVIKTCSFLPHFEKGAYAQTPYEGITKDEHDDMLKRVKPVDWSKYGVSILSDGMCPKFCTNDSCVY